MKDEKDNNFCLSYGYTTESGEKGSTNPSYGVSCATQGGELITYDKNPQLTNVQHGLLSRGLIEPVELTPSYLAHTTPYLQNEPCSQRGHVSNITVNHRQC